MPGCFQCSIPVVLSLPNALLYGSSCCSNTPNHKIIPSLLDKCNFVTVVNCTVISDIQPPKGTAAHRLRTIALFSHGRCEVSGINSNLKKFLCIYQMKFRVRDLADGSRHLLSPLYNLFQYPANMSCLNHLHTDAF